MRRRTLLAGAGALALGACARGAASVGIPPVIDAGAVLPPRFGDRDPHPWSGRAPSEYPVHGIDVSKFQGSIDWRRARAAGVNFAFAKATEGGDRVDDRLAENLAGAAGSGMIPGAYHFYYFCTSPEVQAANYIANVPRMPGAMPPVIDLEWNPFSPTCTTRPPAAEVREVVGRFAAIVQSHYGQRPIIYATPDFYPENQVQLIGAEHWLRAVTRHPDVAYPGADWTFWQYSSTGIVDGVTGDCDLNAFSGSAASWRAWLSQRAQRS